MGIREFIRRKFMRRRMTWPELFGHFKGVLESNNRALELITDMGEKLSGDFLFDENYVRPALRELNSAVAVSVERFGLLTQERYPALKDAYRRIEARLDDAVAGAVAPAGRLVVPLGELTWDMAREAGGKNVNLALVRSGAGLKVPEGFAVTTRAFYEFISANRLGGLMDELRASDTHAGVLLDELRTRVLAGGVPDALAAEVGAALEDMRRLGVSALAVRSSAEEEDGEYSFAGQFETVLNVPAETGAVMDAYRRVVASLFSERAAAYQASLGYGGGRLRMSVGCVAMVDAAVSGVTYSSSPSPSGGAGAGGDIVISAAWGLGVSVVDGTVDADLYTVSRTGEKGMELSITGRRIGDKASLVVMSAPGGVVTARTPTDKGNVPCLTDAQVIELATQAARIERRFRAPQDVEWAITDGGDIYVLQARPLRMVDDWHADTHEQAAEPARPLMSGSGIVVQRGAAAGGVFVIRREDDLDLVPRGAVVVSRTDSANLVKLMPYISAIITVTGAPASHMASLSREFRVPTLVNAGDAAGALRQGQMVTVVFGGDGGAVYPGLFKELLADAEASSPGMESLYEYRKKRQILRHVSLLNLIDPLMDEFAPENCRTVHDLLRFMHEKSVAELIEYAKEGGAGRDGKPVRLELPIPAGIMVVDIGGGLKTGKGVGPTLEDVTSLPLRAVLTGMTHPGVWHSDIVSMNAGDFLSSMMRMPDVASAPEEAAGYNVAVASAEYVNLSLRFGYHFNMLDCYMSGNARNNHIYFRFAGGATDLTKRSRRIELISRVLSGHGFNMKTKGDLIVARLSNVPRDDMAELLDQLGRLISFTRQLDAVLYSDDAVETYARNFAEGRY